MSRKYKDPPFVEAVCSFEFQLSQDSPWDPTMLGLIYAKLKNSFPKKHHQKHINIGFEAISPKSVTQRFWPSDIVKFLNERGNVFVEVHSLLLNIVHSKPYSSWKEFKPLIQEAFYTYQDVVKPQGINSIGLRYINHFEVTGGINNLERYINIRPLVESEESKNLEEKNFLQGYNSFIVGILKPFESSRDFLKVQLFSVATKEKEDLVLRQEIEYYLSKPGELHINDIFKWMENAHEKIENAFEVSIKDTLRSQFEEFND